MAASSKHPHQMPLAEYVECARSKIVAPDGRISRAGVAEVRRDLISRVGYLSTTPDEKAVQEAIKLLDPSVDLTTEAMAQLESIVTSASETITQEGNEMAEAANAPQSPGLENVRGMNNESAKPTYSGGTFSTKRPHYVSPELYRIEAIKDPRERAHAIRAEKSRLRDDRKALSAIPPILTTHPR